MAEETKTEQTPVADAPVVEKGLGAILFPEAHQPEPVAEVKTETPSPVEPTAEEFDLEDYFAKQGIPLEKVKVKTKVDGKEESLSFLEMKKNVQLKRHLDQAGQELGRQRLEAKEALKAIEQERQKFQQVPAVADPDQTNVPSNSEPYNARLEREIAELKAQMSGLNPVIYDVNRQTVAKELKAEGHDDFIETLPEIEAYLVTVKDPALANYYDTTEGVKEVFRQIKLKKMMENQKAPAPTPKAPLEKKQPPIQKIDGGSQPSSIGSVDDWSATQNELLNKWKRTKDTRDLQALLAHQNALSL